MGNKAEAIIEALEPLAATHDLDLVDVEVAGTRKNPILRVFLDTFEGGISLDDLEEAQAWVDSTVEDMDPFACAYMLEVSSPGIDRPLRKLDDYKRFAGQDCVVYLKKGLSPSKVSGILVGVEDGCVVIAPPADASASVAPNPATAAEPDTSVDSDLAVHIDPSHIKKAHLIGHIDFSRNKSCDAGEDKDIPTDTQ